MKKTLMRRLVILPLLLVFTGCMSVEKMIEHASKSKRSWCVYFAGGMGVGEVRASGSGVQADDDGTASSTCDSRAGNVNMNNAGNGMAQAGGITIGPGGTIILPPAPRILQQEAPTFREVDPPPAQQRRAPAVRPQSGSSSRLWELLETSLPAQQAQPVQATPRPRVRPRGPWTDVLEISAEMQRR